MGLPEKKYPMRISASGAIPVKIWRPTVPPARMPETAVPCPFTSASLWMISTPRRRSTAPVVIVA